MTTPVFKRLQTTCIYTCLQSIDSLCMQVKYTMAFLASGYPFPLTFAERVNKTIICITWNVCSLAQNVYFKTGKRLQKDNGEKKIISRVKNMYI